MFPPPPLGFLSSHEVTLTNTSEVLMTYHLRVPEDSSSKGKEFDIHPHSGTLPPNFHQTIRVRPRAQANNNQ